MNLLIGGASTMGYLVVGLFFLRFWRKSNDKLFLFFCAAFWILAAQSVMLILSRERNEDGTIFYVVRLLAFLLILFGIWHKNRARPT